MAIKTDPENTNYYFNVGQMLKNQLSFELAKEYLERAV